MCIYICVYICILHVYVDAYDSELGLEYSFTFYTIIQFSMEVLPSKSFVHFQLRLLMFH